MNTVKENPEEGLAPWGLFSFLDGVEITMIFEFINT